MNWHAKWATTNYNGANKWEYNGNAEQLGYRVQYSRAGSQGRALTHVIADRLEREFTIEDLEEWTEYEVRVQAVNGIGMGPWSQPVRGRTRESGESAPHQSYSLKHMVCLDLCKSSDPTIINKWLYMMLLELPKHSVACSVTQKHINASLFYSVSWMAKTSLVILKPFIMIQFFLCSMILESVIYRPEA